MKNFTISIVGVALLWGLSGCLYHGDYPVSGYYADGYPYTHSYRSAYYDGYPWAYPFGFFSLGYGYSHFSGYYPYKVYNHRPSHHGAHKQAIHKRHDGGRTHVRHLKQNEDDRRSRHQLQNDRPRPKRQIVRDGTRRENKRGTATLKRSVSPRQQAQRSAKFFKQSNHRQRDNPVVRSERRATGKRDFKRSNRANGRRLRCAGGRC